MQVTGQDTLRSATQVATRVRQRVASSRLVAGAFRVDLWWAWGDGTEAVRELGMPVAAETGATCIDD